jgi:hypothetical protein|tara:strand:- start:134 stop:328 length:195 start_codon:yes stop_codon:yes gene_type:complete
VYKENEEKVLRNNNKKLKDDFIEFLVEQQSTDIQKEILRNIIECEGEDEKTVKILIELMKKRKK